MSGEPENIHFIRRREAPPENFRVLDMRNAGFCLKIQGFLTTEPPWREPHSKEIIKSLSKLVAPPLEFSRGDWFYCFCWFSYRFSLLLLVFIGFT